MLYCLQETLHHWRPITNINAYVTPLHDTCPNNIRIPTLEEKVRMGFLLLFTQNIQLVSLYTNFVQPVTSWQSDKNSEPINKHFGGTELLQINFLQLTFANSTLRILFIFLIEKFDCLKNIIIGTCKILSYIKDIFYYPWCLWRNFDK
jgi:uncharacterized Tic20 family protein